LVDKGNWQWASRQRLAARLTRSQAQARCGRGLAEHDRRLEKLAIETMTAGERDTTIAAADRAIHHRREADSALHDYLHDVDIVVFEGLDGFVVCVGDDGPGAR
jgi:hypothetical protein